jgi:hypothetical protein
LRQNGISDRSHRRMVTGNANTKFSLEYREVSGCVRSVCAEMILQKINLTMSRPLDLAELASRREFAEKWK